MNWHSVVISGSNDIAIDETLKALADRYALALQAEIKKNGKPGDPRVGVKKVPGGRLAYFSPDAYAIASAAEIFGGLRVTEIKVPPDLGGFTIINA